MKQFMISKMVLAAMAALPLFASCSSDEDTSSSGNSRELNVRVGIKFIPNSRADNPTLANTYKWQTYTNPAAFAGGETIGLFLRKLSDGTEYGFVTVNNVTNKKETSGPYDNIAYKSSGTGSSQVWAVNTTGSSVVLHPDIDGELCAYYPFLTNRCFDGNVYTYDADLKHTGTTGTGPSATAMAINCASGVDYMYAAYSDCKPVGSSLNGNQPVVDITMHHAQAVLKVSVEVASDFVGSADMTDFLVHGGFAMNGTTNITDGSLTAVMPTNSSGATVSEDTIHVYNTDSKALKTLSTTTKYEAQWFILPISETVPKDLTFIVKIGGHSYNAKVSGVTIQRGWIYEVPLLVTNKSLILHQVVIVPWQTQQITATPLIP